MFIRNGLKFRIKQRVDAAGKRRVITLFIDPVTGERSIGTVSSVPAARRLAEVFAIEEVPRQAQIATTAQITKAAETTATDPSKITLRSYFNDHWIKHRIMATSTKLYYESIYRAGLDGEFGHLDLRDIGETQIAVWVSTMHKAGTTPTMIRARTRALQTILAARSGVSALGDNLITRNPCTRLDIPTVPDREPQIYSPSQVDRLISASDWLFGQAILLKSESGARRSELRAIRPIDLDVKNTAVHIYRSIWQHTNGTFELKSTKNNRGRYVGISSDAMDAMQLLIKRRDLGPYDLLFGAVDKLKTTRQAHDRYQVILDFIKDNPNCTLNDISAALDEKYHTVRLNVMALMEEGCLSQSADENNWTKRYTALTTQRPRNWSLARTKDYPEGVPFSNNWWRDEWSTAIGAANLPHRRPHDIRASAISWMLAGGLDPQTAMNFADHRNWSTTKRYIVGPPEASKGQSAAMERGKQAWAGS